MPYGDGTGPAGYGPMTGRGAGYCAEYDVPGSMNQAPGRRFGRGVGRGFGGRGRGWRNGAPGRAQTGWGYPVQAPYGVVAPFAGEGPINEPGPEQELEMLKNQARYLEDSLKNIVDRIGALEQEPPEK